MVSYTKFTDANFYAKLASAQYTHLHFLKNKVF